jgi:polysaccharide export outer membrane protein
MKTSCCPTLRILSGFLAVTVITSLFVLSSCVIRHERKFLENGPVARQQPTEFFPVAFYRLAPGDVLEVLYLTIPGPTCTPYRLQVKDLVDIEFTFHPEMNRSVRVRPDGRIGIPRKDDVLVAGMTPDEVKRMLRSKYSDLLRDPDITVTVREFNAKLDELQKAITTAPYGQARVITIRPDGEITLPLLADLRAEGLTLPEINQAVNRAYAQVIPEMNVSVILKEVAGNLIFVDGEVEKPGVYTGKGQTTVLQAIAMAGGLKDTAELRTVLVVSKGAGNKFVVRSIDLTQMTGSQDLNLARNDLLFVPKSLIASADIWVDQYIKKLLLFQGWSFGFSYDFGPGSRND